jgi:hypothetical protein
MLSVCLLSIQDFDLLPRIWDRMPVEVEQGKSEASALTFFRPKVASIYDIRAHMHQES